MKIETKFNIGQRVEFNRIISFGASKDDKSLPNVGIIKSISITEPVKTVNGRTDHEPQNIFYYMDSGAYGGPVPECDIKYVLVEDK